MEKLPRQVYTSEFRQQAVEMITRDGLGIAEAARRLSISPKTLTNWVRRAKDGAYPVVPGAPPRGDGSGGRVVAAAAGERRVADGARHLKKSERVLRAGVAARFEMIKELRGEYPVRLLCRVLEVSSSGFHAWLTREPSARSRFRERLKVAAQAAHQRTRQTYGAARLRRELGADGFRVSLGTVKRVRRELGLRCVQRKRRFRVATTDSAHRLPVAPNLLGQRSAAHAPTKSGRLTSPTSRLTRAGSTSPRSRTCLRARSSGAHAARG